MYLRDRLVSVLPHATVERRSLGAIIGGALMLLVPMLASAAPQSMDLFIGNWVNAPAGMPQLTITKTSMTQAVFHGYGDCVPMLSTGKNARNVANAKYKH